MYSTTTLLDIPVLYMYINVQLRKKKQQFFFFFWGGGAVQAGNQEQNLKGVQGCRELSHLQSLVTTVNE